MNFTPRELMWQSREKLHPVIWADPDVEGCQEHPESSFWSHPLMTVRMILLYLEKTLLSKFRGRPELFNVCKNEMLCKTTKDLVETEYWMPLTFRQLLVWGKVRDFKVDLELEGAEDMPETSLL